MGASVDKREVTDALKRVQDAATRNARAMNQVALLLEQFVRNTFRTQSDPWGLAWPEWADRKALLAARKRAGIFSTAKLIAHGDLYDSIHHDSDESSAWVEEGEGLGVYPAVQQFGNANIPPRPSFPMRTPTDVAFPDPWMRAVFAPIRQGLEGAVR